MSQNSPLTYHFPGDFVLEIVGSFSFFFDYIRGKPAAHSAGSRGAVGKDGKANLNFGEAFGVGPAYNVKRSKDIVGGPTTGLAIRPRPSYDEDVRLAPYGYNDAIPAHNRTKSKGSSPPSPSDQYEYAQ
jgi:hypothetical protein